MQIINRDENLSRSSNVKIYLGGVSGVGKSTVARIISSKTKLPVYEVEARKCWNMGGKYRQRCFATKFINLMNQGNGIYTNHIISVYGYTMAMGLEEFAEEVKIVSMVNRRGLVILAISDPEELIRRIGTRIKTDEERKNNNTEENVELHVKAQNYIVELANIIKVPVVYTDNKTPEEVAIEVMRSVGFVL